MCKAIAVPVQLCGLIQPLNHTLEDVATQCSAASAWVHGLIYRLCCGSATIKKLIVLQKSFLYVYGGSYW